MKFSVGLFRSDRRVLPAALFAILFCCLGAAKPAKQDAPKPSEAPFRFVVYGDTRNGHDTHRRLVALIVKQKPDFVLQTGDLVASGGNQKLWTIYNEITAPLSARCAIYPSRGNHDLGGTEYVNHVPASVAASSGTKLYYSFNRGNSHFIGLDCFSPYGPGTPQYLWLEKDLAAAQKTARHTFVFFHIAPYSIGDGHGSDLRLRAKLCPLFTKYGVRAVFNGHEHIYYRTLRSGVPYIISGGGGAPLYGADPNNGAIPGDKWESVHHFVVCEVNGDKVDCETLREDGSELDHFVLTAK